MHAENKGRNLVGCFASLVKFLRAYLIYFAAQW